MTAAEHRSPTRPRLPTWPVLHRRRAVTAAVFRRASLERVGAFDAGTVLGSEIEWVARAEDAGLRFGRLDDAVPRAAATPTTRRAPTGGSTGLRAGPEASYRPPARSGLTIRERRWTPSLRSSSMPCSCGSGVAHEQVELEERPT
jgi:hypothetical protein